MLAVAGACKHVVPEIVDSGYLIGPVRARIRLELGKDVREFEDSSTKSHCSFALSDIVFAPANKSGT